jgi:ribonuclease D
MRDNAAMSGYTWVDDPASLEGLVRDLQGQPRLGVDTEFVRENSFYARLCLVQVCADNEVACVDVQTLGGPGALGELLAEPSVTKVFHSARQDLEVLSEADGRIPAPLRDTQLAAALLGLPEQVGYAQLVEHELGVHLAKGHARTDWSRRPLSLEQLAYAADDVRWLLPLDERLEARLAALGRLEWLADESAALTDPALYAFDAAGAWRRVKGAGQLEGMQLARLAALARWREEEARRRDRPRRWILKDEALVAMARDGEAALRDADLVPPGVIRRHGELLAARLAEAARSEPPPRPAQVRMEPAQDRLVRRAMSRLRELASHHQVAAPLLATRRDVEGLVVGRRDLAILSGWRRELAGQELLALVEGA